MKHNQLFRVILLGVLLFTQLEASAQKEITFGAADDHRTSHKRHSRYARGGDAKNSITVGLVSWLNGYTPIYYERAVISAVSVQVGAGFTSRPYITDLVLGSNDGGSSQTFTGANANDIVDNYGEYKYRKSKPGLYLSIAPKVYYNDDLMDGAYIAPMFEYKLFRWDAQKADETILANGVDDDQDVPHTSAVQPETMRCLDLTINFGGHYQNANHIVFGYSTGIGVRNVHSTRLDIGSVSDPLGNSYYANAVQTYDKTKLLFTFQLTVGGWY